MRDAQNLHGGRQDYDVAGRAVWGVETPPVGMRPVEMRPVEMPPDFVPLFEPIAGCDGRSLGYVGDERFVVFRYEPRVEEVVWNDGHSYGFGTGGWRDFLQHIAPLADRYAARLCLGGAADGGAADGGPVADAGAGGRRACEGADVLVLDRHTGAAYFAGRDSAERFLARLTGAARAPGVHESRRLGAQS